MRHILISVLTAFLLVSGLGATGGRQNIFAATPAYGAGICAVSSAAYPIIASALTDPSCSTIQLKAQTYYEHGLTISRSLTVQGAGSFITVIDAQHLDHALAVPFSPITGTATSPFRVTISNLRIQNGNAEAATIDRGNGGAVDAEGTTALTLQNDDFRNNTGGALGTGGAIYQLNANFGSSECRGCDVVRAAHVGRVGVPCPQGHGMALGADKADRCGTGGTALVGPGSRHLLGPGLWHTGGGCDRCCLPSSTPAPSSLDPHAGQNAAAAANPQSISAWHQCLARSVHSRTTVAPVVAGP